MCHFQSQCWESDRMGSSWTHVCCLISGPSWRKGRPRCPVWRKDSRPSSSYISTWVEGWVASYTNCSLHTSLSQSWAGWDTPLNGPNKQTNKYSWKPNFSWSEAHRRASETGKEQLPNVEMKSWSSQLGGSKKRGGKLWYRFSGVKRNELQVRTFFSFSMGCEHFTV